MGIRGELFSSRVILPNRTYFFNVKENRMGDIYLNIVESKNRDNGGFDRQSVILFADDLQEFLKGFDESLRIMEKAMREKRHTPADAKGRYGNDARFPHDSDGENEKRGEGRKEKPGRGERAGHGERDRYNRTGEKPGRGEKGRYKHTGEKSTRGERSRKGEYKSDYRPAGGRRVVVKKKD